LVILLHGFGAPGDDLVPLAREVDAPPGTLFLFPEAPIIVDAGIGGSDAARAWWPIDVVRVQVAMMSGRFEEAAEMLRPGMQPAVEVVSELVEQARGRYQVASDRTVVGGFSQGAIVALEFALQRYRRPFAGLLLFSGAYLDGKTLEARARSLAPMPCVVSHGQVDPILPYSLGENLGSELARAGWCVDWVPFLGGHGIPPKAAQAAGRLLRTQLT
jgi:phospholipase/carboxylesterase